MEALPFVVVAILAPRCRQLPVLVPRSLVWCRRCPRALVVTSALAVLPTPANFSGAGSAGGLFRSSSEGLPPVPPVPFRPSARPPSLRSHRQRLVGRVPPCRAAPPRPAQPVRLPRRRGDALHLRFHSGWCAACACACACVSRVSVLGASAWAPLTRPERVSLGRV